MKALLELSDLKYNAIKFNEIKEEDFIPALKKAIEIAKERIESWKKESSTDFDDCIAKLENCSQEVGQVLHTFYTLFHAHSTEKLQSYSEEFSSLYTQFSNDISLDEDIFNQIKTCYDAGFDGLTIEQKNILEKTYKDFIRNGALLSEADKEKLRKIDQELSALSIKFNQNTLKATNDYKLFVSDASKVEGMPESALQAASELAKKEGKDGQWCFTLQYPSMLPVLKYCSDRQTRKEMFMALNKKCASGETDNRDNVKKQVKLRHERAMLLGYASHAAFVLEQKMAKDPKTVNNFIKDLTSKSQKFAKEDMNRVKAFAKDQGLESFEGWDFSFYSEKLKLKELDFNDEVTKPYFECNRVLNGMFEVATKLYNISLKEIKDVPVYHEDVKTFEVFDNDKNEVIGLFYVDLFPRDTKSSGAWMMGIRDHGLTYGEVRKPLVSITCNFTRPSGDTPSLLTINEVLTLFHEFGHALHGLLSKCQYQTLSGTNVLHDFVELPSQIMENWVYEKECLDIIAAHYQTNEKMPADLLEKLKKSSQFLEGYATMRQLTFGTLDMAWHSAPIENIEELDVEKFEVEALKDVAMFKHYEGSVRSTSFGHLFAGGYSAGYYGYKWAEVLDADAFEAFKENGIFDRSTAKKFRENILEKGGSVHPMDLYIAFKGREPKVDALLKRAGFSL